MIVFLFVSFVKIPVRHSIRDENATIKSDEVPEAWQGEGKKDKNKLAQKDTDAYWTKKNNSSYFGYKDHVMGDSHTKLITDWLATNASVHNSQVFQELLLAYLPLLEGGKMLADSAYYSAEAEEFLDRHKINSQIHERGFRN